MPWNFKIQRVLAMIIGVKPIVEIDKRGHVIMYLVVIMSRLHSLRAFQFLYRDLFLDPTLNPLDA